MPARGLPVKADWSSEMDKAYTGDIPRHRKTLVELKREFSRIPTTTDWTKLRIEPLLRHVTALEHLLRSAKFSRERARLRKGVAMFHADLVYLRANIKALKEILAAERRSRDIAKKRKSADDLSGSARSKWPGRDD